MPKDEYDPEDPNVLVGIPMPEEPAAGEEMARSLIEEYCLMGYDPTQILSLFESPFYLITHQIYRVKGKERIAHWIDETFDSFRKERV
jgi:hypothetical protein